MCVSSRDASCTNQEDAFSMQDREKAGWLVGGDYGGKRWYKTSKAFQASMGRSGDFNLNPPTKQVTQVGR